MAMHWARIIVIKIGFTMMIAFNPTKSVLRFTVSTKLTFVRTIKLSENNSKTIE